jgi:hypothetical protein
MHELRHHGSEGVRSRRERPRGRQIAPTTFEMVSPAAERDRIYVTVAVARMF